MKSRFFTLIFSFVFLVGLFIQNDSLLGQSQLEDPFIQKLKKFSLPSDQITENDMPKIKMTIQQVLDIISEHLNDEFKKTSENQTIKPRLYGKTDAGSDRQPLISGLFLLRNWLNQQKCVRQSSFPLVEASGKYSAKILASFPGQIPIGIIFNCKTDKTKEYNLLIFTDTPASLKFADLSENKE